ncbi:site-specific integrase [Paenibacillus xylanexedens]|uniref:tyrosine-type recombinase/integrase n=1 Tax=Paenibacillus xylanexedens TaxID=528191 RepID=UPI001F49154B|nr:tyrosine-type recombinase/integrase [Paenibacillus xylanexedens]MCF7753185.1 site-specific integrase [Paenibacillus xylanexedens]
MTTTINLVSSEKSHYLITYGENNLLVEWTDDYEILENLINEIRKILTNKDLSDLSLLPTRFKLQNRKLMYSICENLYPLLFKQSIHSYGLKLLTDKVSINKTQILKCITSTSLGTNFTYGYLGLSKEDTCIDNALIEFDTYISPYIAQALIAVDTEFIKKSVYSLSLTKFSNIVKTHLHVEFSSYLNQCAKILFDNNKSISRTSLIILSLKKNNPDTVSAVPLLKKLLDKTVDTWNKKELKLRKKQDIRIGSPLWLLSYQDVELLRYKTLDFSKMDKNIAIEIQQYLKHWHSLGENAVSIQRRFARLNALTTSLSLQKTPITSLINITYVEALTIVDILHQIKNKEGKRKYSVKTIQSIFSEARLLFDWLKNEQNKESFSNPFRRYKFHNINSFVQNAKFIPEDVVAQLTLSIKDCPEHVQRIWLIMMNTGARAGEILNLEEDCLRFNDREGCYFLSFIANKTSIIKRKKGIDDYHEIPILNDEIVDMIRKQILKTQHLRSLSQTKYIFIHKNESRNSGAKEPLRRYLSTNIANHINKCIKKNQILDKDGSLWRYSNHQCRKTLAVKLLSKGSSISEVGEVLNHSHDKTTLQYYHDVDAQKIADLDYNLFEALFQSVHEDVKKFFTTQELDDLKNEILSGSRETPEGHGSCIKHVSFGPCKKKSCVGCSLLLTGPEKLPMWETLYTEQITYIKTLTTHFLSHGIEDYKEYRDYQHEVHLLTLYMDTVSKLQKFIEDRM